MSQDPYAILGLLPDADQAEIRSAYRALMRRYHPDADSSDEAADQARAINQAYAILGDPARRAAHDGVLAPRSALQFEPVELHKPRKGWGAQIGVAGAVSVALVAVAMVTYAVIPRVENEVFRDERKAQSRTAPARAARVQTPAAEPDRKLAASPVQDIPKAIEAEVSLIRALPAPLPSKPKVVTAVTPQPKDTPTLARQANSRCPDTLGRAERIMCGDENLASLDRQLSLLYRQSWAAADERKRAALIGTRQIFIDRRDDCETPNCLTSAYVVRLKEISDIMGGRSRP